jgi:hypothetical protein
MRPDYQEHDDRLLATLYHPFLTLFFAGRIFCHWLEGGGVQMTSHVHICTQHYIFTIRAENLRSRSSLSERRHFALSLHNSLADIPTGRRNLFTAGRRYSLL